VWLLVVAGFATQRQLTTANVVACEGGVKTNETCDCRTPRTKYQRASTPPSLASLRLLKNPFKLLVTQSTEINGNLSRRLSVQVNHVRNGAISIENLFRTFLKLTRLIDLPFPVVRESFDPTKLPHHEIDELCNALDALRLANQPLKLGDVTTALEGSPTTCPGGEAIVTAALSRFVLE